MIIPAIIPHSVIDLEEKLALLNFADWLQIDIVDGRFDDNVSWPYEPGGNVEDAAIPFKGRRIELDLMVETPRQAAEDWYHAGARRFVFHFGSLTIDEFTACQQAFDAECGIALAANTPLSEAHPFIAKADFVQIMGIREIGAQGQPFDAGTIERVATMKRLYPEKPLSVDGGIGESNIAALGQAGVERFVVGSAILKADDPEAEYRKLLKIAAAGSAAAL